jgi:hypothetical protein
MSNENAEDLIRVVPTHVDRNRLQLMLDLTGFQRDLLFVLARLSGTHPNGVDLREELNDVFGATITEARLYQNLRELHDADLVAKRPIDGRTNAYQIEHETMRSMRAYVDWSESCLEAPYMTRGSEPAVVIGGDRG